VKAVVRTSENTAVILGPVSGIMAATIWLFWIFYVLTAFVFVLAIIATVVAVLWIVHDVKAYKVRKTIRERQAGMV